MIDNQPLLHQLFNSGRVRAENAPLLWSAPAPLPAGLPFERVEGMLLGLACGDALGNTSESMKPFDREEKYGRISAYIGNKHAGMRKVGLPSDDTQMAFWTVEVLLEDGGLDPEHLARRFTAEPIFGIGNTVKEFVRAYKDQKRPWYQAGPDSAGNGALMRIAPVLLPHLRGHGAGLWADALLAGMLTHNNRASNAACAAFTAMLWDLLGMTQPPAPDWWLERYCAVAAPLEGSQAPMSPRMPGLIYTGPLWQFAQEQVSQAWRQNWTTLQAGNTWGSGAFLMETVPAALYILMQYAHDPEQAVTAAVNDTRDNDTIAAIVGAAVGALHGKAALPERWLAGLSGRTNAGNDGHVQELILQAKMRFWDGESTG
jgi:ADP-ribosylglycohydrolase